MMTYRLYLHHGWSYDASFWRPMLRHLPEATPTCVDEGYYGPPATPPLPKAPYWAVGHSAGVMALLGQNLPGCCGIIALNGFAQFYQSETFPNGIAPRVLERMHRRMSIQPAAVLRSFRDLCGDSSTIAELLLNRDRLQDGLERLQNDNHHNALSRWNGRLYSLTATDDPLAPARQGLSSPAYTSLHKGGHLLPLTDPEGCAAFIHHIVASHDI